MKSQELLTALYAQVAKAVGCYSEHDVRTLSSRVTREGRSFLEMTLPTIDDILLKGLADGALPAFVGWERKGGAPWPAFLHGMWQKVFDRSGSVLANPDVRAIRAIRQISRAFKKVFEVCSDERVDEATTAFIDTDRALSRVRFPKHVHAITEVAHHLFGGVVGRAISSDLPFRHGPGAVADGLDSVERWGFPSVSPDIEELVGIEWTRASWHDLLNNPPSIEVIPARLHAVPKTALKPRLISIEPGHNQFLQQGLAARLRDGLCAYRACNITDQGHNQELARIASIDGALCTIDLSEASDRIHNGLVKEVFSWNPAFVRYLQATRSSVVRIGERDLLLNKFASMGSALTFPVQTMVFTTLAVYAMCVQERDFSRATVRSYLTGEKLGVYGDDICMPSKYAPTFISLIEELGLKVNTDKTFTSGLFRESCGTDWYGGHDVTPSYVRRREPECGRDVRELVAISSFRNQIVAKWGYGEVTELVDSTVVSILGSYPAGPYVPTDGTDEVGRPTPSGVVRVGPEDSFELRWNSALQRSEFACWGLQTKRRKARGTDISRLNKTLMQGFQEDPLHLTHHGRPVSAKLKHRTYEVR